MPPDEDLTLEDLMAELVRNAREQAASDATHFLLGKVWKERREVRGDEGAR